MLNVKTVTLRAAAAVLAAICQVAANGQGINPRADTQDLNPRHDQLTGDTFKLRTTITLDREEYFPGETAQVTITVENSTSDGLQVWKPFDHTTGHVYIFRRLPTKTGSNSAVEGWLPLEVPEDGGNPRSNSPTAWVQAGEKMELKFRLNGIDGMDQETHLFRSGLLPTTEGEYRLSYWNGSARFRIVYPKLEKWIDGPFLSKPHVYEPPVIPGAAIPGAPRSGVQIYKRRVPAMVLGYEGKHVLVVTYFRLAAPEPGFIAKGQGTFTADVQNQFGPFQRVATSDRPIELLDVQAVGETDEVMVAYKEQGGRGGRIRLDSKRKTVVDH